MGGRSVAAIGKQARGEGSINYLSNLTSKWNPVTSIITSSSTNYRAARLVKIIPAVRSCLTLSLTPSPSSVLARRPPNSSTSSARCRKPRRPSQDTTSHPSASSAPPRPARPRPKPPIRVPPLSRLRPRSPSPPVSPPLSQIPPLARPLRLKRHPHPLGPRPHPQSRNQMMRSAPVSVHHLHPRSYALTAYRSYPG